MSKTIKFSGVAVGTKFQHDGSRYLKCQVADLTEAGIRGRLNAYSFDGGFMTTIADDEEVRPLGGATRNMVSIARYMHGSLVLPLHGEYQCHEGRVTGIFSNGRGVSVSSQTEEAARS